jgi:hypothetical protein
MLSQPGVDISRITEVVTPGGNEDERSVLILKSEGWPRWRGWIPAAAPVLKGTSISKQA